MNYLNWPVRAMPGIRLTLDAEHRKCNFTPVYDLDCHALHFYRYSCTMKLGKMLIDIQPGDVTISPARIPSSYLVAKHSRHFVCHFDTIDIPAGSETVRLPLHPPQKA